MVATKGATTWGVVRESGGGGGGYDLLSIQLNIACNKDKMQHKQYTYSTYSQYTNWAAARQASSHLLHASTRVYDTHKYTTWQNGVIVTSVIKLTIRQSYCDNTRKICIQNYKIKLTEVYKRAAAYIIHKTIIKRSNVTSEGGGCDVQVVLDSCTVYCSHRLQTQTDGLELVHA